MTAKRVAAIDCGTNSIRLLVADVNPAGTSGASAKKPLRIAVGSCTSPCSPGCSSAGSGAASGCTHGPLRHHSGSIAMASSPSGLTPGPAAREWPTSTCRHFTRSGMPPALGKPSRTSMASRRAM